MKKIILLSLSSLMFFTTTSLAATPIGQEDSVALTLKNVKAFHENASPAPKYNKECRILYHKYFGKTIRVHYSVDPKSLQESANAKVAHTDVRLFPMGLSGQYAFLSDGVPSNLQQKHLINLYFSVSTNWSRSKTALLFKDPKTKGINCSLGS